MDPETILLIKRLENMGLGTSVLEDSTSANGSSLSSSEISRIISEAIDNLDLVTIESFPKHVELGRFINSDHIMKLISNTSPESANIIRFLKSNFKETYVELYSYYFHYLSVCINNDNFEVFQILFEIIPVQEVDLYFLGEILAKTANSKSKRFYNFIIDQVQYADDFGQYARFLISNAFYYSIAFNLIEAIEFITKNGDISLAALNLAMKNKILKISVAHNHAELVRELISFPDVKSGPTFLPHSLAMEAIMNDFSDVFDVFMEFFTETSLKANAMFALSFGKIKILEYLKTMNILDESMLYSMFQSAILNHNKQSLELIVHLGFNILTLNKEGQNILTIAVIAEEFEIVEYLLVDLLFDVNTANINPETGESISTAIEFAKSAEMKSLLTIYGAICAL